MSKKTIFLILSISAFIAFIVLTIIVKTDRLNQFDFNTTVRIQDNIPTRFDDNLYVLSILGSVEIISIPLIIILLYSRQFLFMFAASFLYVAAHVSELIGKAFLHHPGPPHLLFRGSTDFSMPSAYVQPGSSYPSGHSLRIVFVIFLALYFLWISKLHIIIKTIITLFLMGITILMLLSRISLGEHWTTDVIGGSCIGVGIAYLSLIFYKEKRLKDHSKSH